MKKIIKTTVILLASVTTFQGCFDVDDGDINAVCNADCTTIQGRFTTEDGKPIKDLNIEIDWDITNGGLGVSGLSGKTRKIMTGKTDGNGNYKSVFHAKDEELEDGSFIIKYDASEDIYIVQKNYTFIQFYGINKRDTVVTTNYHVPKRGATIELKIKNPETITGDNQIVTRVYYKSNSNINAGELSSKTGSTATFKTAANQFTYIKTTKTIAGQDFNFLDSVFISVNQTKRYEIEF